MALYRTTVALAIKGSRYEKNSEVSLSEDEASMFDPADLVLVGAEPAADESAPADVPLQDMTVPQLKERAKELGLATTGTKADLQERITLHLSSGAAPEGGITSE